VHDTGTAENCSAGEPSGQTMCRKSPSLFLKTLYLRVCERCELRAGHEMPTSVAKQDTFPLFINDENNGENGPQLPACAEKEEQEMRLTVHVHVQAGLDSAAWRSLCRAKSPILPFNPPYDNKYLQPHFRQHQSLPDLTVQFFEAAVRE